MGVVGLSTSDFQDNYTDIEYEAPSIQKGCFLLKQREAALGKLS